MDAVAQLATYIRTHSSFTLVELSGETYKHMGAIITDVSLQAGINYKHVVLPRVQRLMHDHPDASTTSAFLSLLRTHGVSALLDWNGARKAATVQAVAEFFHEHHVETETHLKVWLRRPTNLLRFGEIKGIGPKSVDYIQILVGMPAVAIDVHLLRFLAEAGIHTTTYEEAREIISGAAAALGISPTALDSSIWTYMSQRRDRS